MKDVLISVVTREITSSKIQIITLEDLFSLFFFFFYFFFPYWFIYCLHSCPTVFASWKKHQKTRRKHVVFTVRSVKHWHRLPIGCGISILGDIRTAWMWLWATWCRWPCPEQGAVPDEGDSKVSPNHSDSMIPWKITLLILGEIRSRLWIAILKWHPYFRPCHFAVLVQTAVIHLEW